MMLIGKQHIGSDKETGMKRIIHVLFMLLILSSLLSCQHREPENISIYRYDEYISDNFDNYTLIRKAARDTLAEWKDDSLTAATNIFYGETWTVDSILLFNRDSTRLFTTINRSYDEVKDAKVDYVSGLQGINIKGKWYFLMGGNHYIGRAGRKKDVYEAMTFEELSYISHSRIMARFLKVDEKGNYTVDYDELDYHFYKRYKTYGDEDKIDSLQLTRIAAYHKKKIDPKTIERVKESRKNSVRPPEVPKPKKSLIRRLFEEEEKTPLFETQEWKNRRKKNDDNR